MTSLTVYPIETLEECPDPHSFHFAY